MNGSAEALTRREVIRALLPFSKSSTVRGVGLFLSDWVLYWICIAGILFLPGLGWKIAASMFAASRLPNMITLGHDAAHGALTPHKRLNWLLGVLCLTPCLMNYRLWVFDHHVLHHRNTNRDHKDTWTPISKAEFDAFSAWKQALHRFYRHPNVFSLAIYYAIERWSYSKIIPLAHVSEKYRPSAWRHFIFLLFYAVLFITALALAPQYSGTTSAEALLLGFVLPFFVELASFSWVLWAMHTLPEVGWFRPQVSPMQGAEASELVSVHLELPAWFEIATHGITNHPVHHLLPAIPIYHLGAAQAKYAELVGVLNVKHKFSFRNLFDTARRCKLYDFENNRWLDFEGNPTGELTRPFCHAEAVARYLDERG